MEGPLSFSLGLDLMNQFGTIMVGRAYGSDTGNDREQLQSGHWQTISNTQNQFRSTSEKWIKEKGKFSDYNEMVGIDGLTGGWS